MKKTTIQSGVLAICLMLGGTLAISSEYADHCSMHGHAVHHHRSPGTSLHLLHRMVHQADMLGLDDKQQKTLGTILTDASAKIATIRVSRELEATSFSLRIHHGGLDKKAIHAYAKKMGTLQADMLTTRLLAIHKAMAVLDKKQKAMLWQKTEHSAHHQQAR